MAGLPAERSSSDVGARLLLLARRAPGLVAMLLMALVGLGISIYLTTIHYQGVAPICNTTGVIDCAAVTSSAYSVLPGPGKISITIPGMLWFVVSGGMALVALLAIWRNRPEPSWLRLAHLLWGAVGMVFVLYLVYAEIVTLQRLCEWCTVVHLLTFATFLLALNRWQQRGLPAPDLRVAAVGVRRSSDERASASAAPASNGGKARQAALSTRQPLTAGKANKAARRSRR